MISIETTLKNHPNLTTTAFCVYYAIYEKIKNRGQKSTIYRIKDIASLCGISPKLVQRSVTQLRDEGLIIIEKQGRDNLYSLPDGDTKTTKKNSGQNRPARKEKQTKTTVNNDRNAATDMYFNNIYKINISESESDNQISTDPVDLEYNKLMTWFGSQPLFIGYIDKKNKKKYDPCEVKEAMQYVTPEQRERISDIYAAQKVEHQTAWIQAALMQAAHESMSLHNKPIPKIVPKNSQSKIHFENERQYDFDELEKRLLRQQHARSQGRTRAK